MSLIPSVLARNWETNYPNFKEEKFRCKHTGKIGMKHHFMLNLQELRDRYGKPMIVGSGFRDKTHPDEAKKKHLGAHPQGVAVDISVDRTNCYELLQLALAMGCFTGIGLQQKGGGRFLHLDMIPEGTEGYLRPTVWTY